MDSIDLSGVIVADTIYYNNQLSAKESAFTLPAVNPLTNDYRAMGTMTLPTMGLIEAMETTITKIGIDRGLKTMLRPESATLEYRWVQNVVKPDGSQKPEGCKAFLRVVPKGIPGMSIDPGSSSENELGFFVTRYQLFVAGEEYWLVDRLNGILRIGGNDYAKDIFSML